MAGLGLGAGVVVVVLDSASWGANCVVTDIVTALKNKKSRHLEVEKKIQPD